MSIVVQLGSLSFPASPEDLFDRPGPLVLEVGFGDGRFTAGLARRHPDWNILGVELAPASVTRAYRRMRREGIGSVRLYQGDARFLVRNVIPPRSLHRVYVNFPDPWPKERHQDRRLLQVPFYRLLSTRLAEGGQLLFTSDHEEYFFFAVEQARASGLFAIERDDPPPATLETKYALRWREQQKTIRHAIITKTGEADEAFSPTIQPQPMHHVLLEGSLDQVRPFDEKVQHAFPGGRVILLDQWRDLGDDRRLFLALVDEGTLRQDVLVEARPSEGGIFVALKRFGTPVVSDGVREAVRAVAAYLQEQGLTLVQDAT